MNRWGAKIYWQNKLSPLSSAILIHLHSLRDNCFSPFCCLYLQYERDILFEKNLLIQGFAVLDDSSF